VTPIFSPYLKRKSFWRPFIFYIHNSMARIFLLSFLKKKSSPNSVIPSVTAHKWHENIFFFWLTAQPPRVRLRVTSPRRSQSSPLYSTCRSFGDDRVRF
jgi:hypothetical protein